MWSRKFEQCVGCGTSAIPHSAKGYCAPCYQRKYAAEKHQHLAEYKRQWYMTDHEANLVKRKAYRETLWFNSQREAVLNRDGNKCTQCGRTTSLVVHHKDGNGRRHKTPNNNLDNLITLCRYCHPSQHAGKRTTTALTGAPCNGRKRAYSKLQCWSKAYECCIVCGCIDSAHRGKGICNRCYLRQYKKT